MEFGLIISYLKMQASILIPSVFGAAIAVLISRQEAIWISTARVLCGLFCAIYFTAPIVHYMEWHSETYTSAVAGLLAINGFQLVKFFTNTPVKDIVKSTKLGNNLTTTITKEDKK